MAKLPTFNNRVFNRSAKNLRESSGPPPFSLICKNGTVMRFHLKAMAELYQSLYGGTILQE